MPKKIVVLGGGYAGILTAKKLEKRFKKDGNIEITIIDKNPFHTMLTELHEVAAWRVEEDSIKISLKRVFAGRKVNVVLDNIVSTDFDQKKLIGAKDTYDYDYLVFASGSKPTSFGIPGVMEYAFKLWSYDDAVLLRGHIMNMFRKASREVDPELKKQYLTFYTIGAGFTGVEMVGELAELVPSLCKRFEIDRNEVTIVCVDVLDRVCSILPEKATNRITNRLNKMGVKLLLGTGITGVGEDFVEYKQKDTVQTVKTSTVIWGAGIEGSDIVTSSSALGAAGRGRIQTDEFLRSQNYKDVWIAGDNIFYIPEGEQTPVPQMVENCEACADTIAHNIATEVTGKGNMESYKPSFHGVMVCVGGRWGSAHVGAGKNFFVLPSFFAMMSKHFINIIYFLQVLGWNKVFSYIKHEFFTIRDCRSFVGGHLSNRSPSFFLMPLRVFLGGIWLYEGVVKVGEGWLKSPKLTNFFGWANAWYDSILGNPTVEAMSAATGEVVEVASSATGEVVEAVAAASPVLINWNIFNLVKIILVNSGDIAFKIQVSFVDWIINSFVIPYDGVQMVFQNVIVFSEILVGLALIAGLFTTVSSAYSLVLQVMFITSTGLYLDSWWMIFAAIAMLFGGGRVLALDYYVIPALKRWWSNLGFVKKWYIYHD